MKTKRKKERRKNEQNEGGHKKGQRTLFPNLTTRCHSFLNAGPLKN